MQRLQAFKYELMPNGEQAAPDAPLRRLLPVRLQQGAGVADRSATNKARRSSAMPGCASALTEWRNRARHAVARPMRRSHPLQQTLKDLERAYANFFAKRADVAALQEERPWRDSFRYPRPEADQARPGQQPHLPAQARLAALPQQPRMRSAR
ncbi:MAG: hypothetical protein MZV65_19815 [Chromatiales bacterium]|nr:hypothetical protein [Chromatiales bacterium]